MILVGYFNVGFQFLFLVPVKFNVFSFNLCCQIITLTVDISTLVGQ